MLKGYKKDFGLQFPCYGTDLVGPPGSKWIVITNVDEYDYGRITESLIGDKLTLPIPSQICSLESFSVKRVLFLNEYKEDKVPFFLEEVDQHEVKKQSSLNSPL